MARIAIFLWLSHDLYTNVHKTSSHVDYNKTDVLGRCWLFRDTVKCLFNPSKLLDVEITKVFSTNRHFIFS